MNTDRVMCRRWCVGQRVELYISMTLLEVGEKLELLVGGSSP